MKHITALEDRLVPPMERFTALMGTYAKDNLDMRCCVRSFDELLCQKVNK